MVYENTEIYLLISENIAVSEESLTKNISNIEQLAGKIFEQNAKTKIGIVGIKGTINDTREDGDKTIIGEKDESDVNGSANNAEIVVNLTNDLNTLTTGLQNMNTSKTKYYTNLQAAIRLANQSYTDKVNKILISLFDKVPSISIGVCGKVSYGWFQEYTTVEEAVTAKHEKIASYTRQEILTLKESNVQFILLRPQDTSYDETWFSMSTGEKVLEFDGSPYVNKLYGTIENPTYGKMYSFDESNIDTIVTENIYADVKELIQPDIYDVKIINHFPKEIIDNFNFEYVGKPSLGNVSENIDTTTNTIQWDIGTLKGNESATLKYKLKLKDMKNAALLNKTIATSEKTVVTYKDTANKDYTATLSDSPKIKLAEVKEQDKLQGEDGTTSKNRLPNAGMQYLIIALAMVVLIVIINFIKTKLYKDVK